MSGSATEPNKDSDTVWYNLIDPASDRVVGQVSRDGKVRSADADVARRVTQAFDRQLLIRDNAIAEELGVCFADVETVEPGHASHHDLVFRNLALLTGLIPVAPDICGKAE